MRRAIALLVGVLGLAGCATQGPNLSYVGSPLAVSSAAPIASEIATYAAGQLPAAQSTILLEPPPPGQAANDLTPAVTAALRAKGFGIAEPGTSAANAHSLRYIVTPVGQDVLLRIIVDNRIAAARLYQPDGKGSLVAASPLTAMENGS